MFGEIGRDYGEMGTPMAFKNAEIIAYQEVEGRRLKSWEVEAIRKLDRAFRKVEGEARQKESERQKAADQPNGS